MEVVRNARTVFYVLRRRGIERGSYLHVKKSAVGSSLIIIYPTGLTFEEQYH